MFFLGVASSSGGMLAYCPVLCRSRDACIVHGISHVTFVLSGRPSIYGIFCLCASCSFVRALVSIATLLDLFNKYLTKSLCLSDCVPNPRGIRARKNCVSTNIGYGPSVSSLRVIVFSVELNRKEKDGRVTHVHSCDKVERPRELHHMEDCHGESTEP